MIRIIKRDQGEKTSGPSLNRQIADTAVRINSNKHITKPSELLENISDMDIDVF